MVEIWVDIKKLESLARLYCPECSVYREDSGRYRLEIPGTVLGSFSTCFGLLSYLNARRLSELGGTDDLV